MGNVYTFSQIALNKGIWNIGGEFSGSYSQNDIRRHYPTTVSKYTSNNYHFRTRSSVGYTPVKHLVLTSSLAYSHRHSEQSIASTTSIHNAIGLSETFKYYFATTHPFSFFLEGDLEYQFRWWQVLDGFLDTNRYSESKLIVLGGIGVSCFFKDNVSIDLNLLYGKSNLNTNTGLYSTFGCTFYFLKKGSNDEK